MSSKKYIAALFCIVFIEAFIILVVLGNGHKGIIGGDGKYYHDTSLNLLHHGAFTQRYDNNDLSPTMLRPPGYSFFLAIIYGVFGESFFIVRVIHFFMIWCIALGIYSLAKLYCDEACAKVSGILCATYLPLIFIAIYHYGEILTIILLILIIYFAKSFTDKSEYLHAILTGVALGCLVLVRANFMLFVFFLAGGFILSEFFSRKRLSIAHLKKVSVFVIIFFLVITPWLLRNKFISGKWRFGYGASQSLYVSLLQYNGKLSYAFTVKDWEMFLADGNKRIDKAKIELNNRGTRMDLEYKIEESYQDSLREEIKNFSVYRLPKSLLLRIPYLWSTSDISPPEIYATFYHRIAQAHYLLISLLIGVGVWLRRKRILSDWLLWITALYLTLVHLFFHVEARYTLPARPFLLVYAAVALTAIFHKLKNLENKKIATAN